MNGISLRDAIKEHNSSVKAAAESPHLDDHPSLWTKSQDSLVGQVVELVVGVRDDWVTFLRRF